MGRIYKYETIILQGKGEDNAYIVFPYDLKREFGRNRVNVDVSLDGEKCRGSIMYTGLKDDNGKMLFVIQVTSTVRRKINKSFGDTVSVEVSES